MNKSVKIGLLGLMIWVIKFIAGSFIFLVFTNAQGGPTLGMAWISAISEFAVVIGLALALFLVYRDKVQDYRRTAWQAGIAWYVIILLMDLIAVIGLLGVELKAFSPSILSSIIVLIIPIVVGYLLAGLKTKFGIE